jgi:hypothetical protein
MLFCYISHRTNSAGDLVMLKMSFYDVLRTFYLNFNLVGIEIPVRYKLKRSV